MSALFGFPLAGKCMNVGAEFMFSWKREREEEQEAQEGRKGEGNDELKINKSTKTFISANKSIKQQEQCDAYYRDFF